MIGVKEKATLRLLPYRADQIDLTVLRSHLAENQHQRFDSLLGRRQAEFGVTRLFLQHCLKLSFQEYLNTTPDIINIIEQKNLPPRVTTTEKIDLDFSISHSKNLIAIITAKLQSKDTLWGLDVEQCRPVKSHKNAELFCNKAQLSVLEKANSQEYIKQYYQYWTQKEAVLKAKKTGIIDPNLKAIDGVPCIESSHLCSTRYAHPLDKNNYLISAFCQENTGIINSQQINLDEQQTFSPSQMIDLSWQNYDLALSC